MVFVVLDGSDASGKSTQAARLYRLVANQGHTAFIRVHPSGDCFFGTRARQYLYSEGKSAHFASALFYMLDVIRSVLLYSWRRYDFVVFVRYLMGTAYLPSPLHRIAYHFFAVTMPTSGFMFFLDIRPEEAYRRIEQTRDKREMFENLRELQRIRFKALSLASIGHWIIVDANKSEAEIQEIIMGILEKGF